MSAPLELETQDAADPASCRCAQCAAARPAKTAQRELLVTATEVTIRLWAEVKNDDTYVMSGKRCIEQKCHRNEADALAYLARHWGLRPRKTKKRSKPATPPSK